MGFRALVLAKDPDSIPSTDRVAHRSIEFKFWGSGTLHGHQAWMWYTYTYVGKTLIYIQKSKINKEMGQRNQAEICLYPFGFKLSSLPVLVHLVLFMV